MDEKGHNSGALPKMTVSFNDRERERLERLSRRWGMKYSRALALAVTHALASLERDEAIHTAVPSEQEETER